MTDTAGYTGFGVTCNLILSGTSSAVGNFLDVDYPAFQKFLADATYHSATGGYGRYMDTGQRELPMFTMTLGWDETNAATNHSKFRTAFDWTGGVAMLLTSPDAKTLYFECFIQKVGQVVKQKAQSLCSIDVQPSQAPTRG